MKKAGDTMKKETEARFDRTGNQQKKYNQNNRIESKEMNIGDGWSIRVEKGAAHNDLIRLRT